MVLRVATGGCTAVLLRCLVVVAHEGVSALVAVMVERWLTGVHMVTFGTGQVILGVRLGGRANCRRNATTPLAHFHRLRLLQVEVVVGGGLARIAELVV